MAYTRIEEVQTHYLGVYWVPPEQRAIVLKKILAIVRKALDRRPHIPSAS